MRLKLSIIVPTMNRPQFVERLLAYYARQAFSHCIYIGDSSGDLQHREAIVAAVERVKDKIKVEYVHCPNNNIYEVVQKIVDKVLTPYVSYLADDDFLVPKVIEECIEFMESHSDYSCACGRAVMFKLNNSGAYGSFDAASYYPAYGIEDEKPDVRLMKHLSQYTSAFHSVCRTKMMRKALEKIFILKREMQSQISYGKTMSVMSNFGELLLSCSLLIQGKLKRIGSLYYIRQVHDARYLSLDWFELISNPSWQSGIRILREQLVEYLEGQGCLREKAEKTVKQALWVYVAQGGMEKLRKQNGSNSWKQRLKDQVKYFPQLKKLWRFVRSYKDRFALEAVLRPSSNLHKHFMPVYSLVSNEKERNI